MNPGCLLIHGFGGDVSEVKPLQSYLNEKGFTVKCSHLDGHTGVREDLRHVDCLDWIASAQDDLEDLKAECDCLFIIGFSMGGLIAANLAVNNKVVGIATLNSPIYCWHKRQILSNILQDLKQSKHGHISHYLESTVKFPIQALLQFNLLLKRTKVLLHYVKCPVFIAQALKDDTVSPKSAEYIRRQLGSDHKEVKYYEESGHLICHGPDRQVLFNDLHQFITHLNSRTS